MAVSVSSIELASLRQSAAAAPLLSPTVNFSRRNINIRKHWSGKFRSTLVKSAVPSAGATVDHVVPKVADVVPKVAERDFSGTPYIPVFVMLPEGSIDGFDLVNTEDLIYQLKILKSFGVDGVAVNCWWGIVENSIPTLYKWTGYRKLFEIVRDLKLKMRVVMCFHECGGTTDDDVHIPLPKWVLESGRENPDIFFTDREERRNNECLTWGIDNRPVLSGRTAVEVYTDFMRSFRIEFNEFFEDGLFFEIEIGLGPRGELRYPSHPVKHGWKYPGVGEFQCFDKYLLDSLKNTFNVRGHISWHRNRVPNNAGSYNSKPHETEFFSPGRVSFGHEMAFFCPGRVPSGPEVDYDSYHGRLFLDWYSGVLIDHADQVLTCAKMSLRSTSIAAKLPGIHWWYRTSSHAAELTAGFYHKIGHCGYTPIASMLKKHGIGLNFTCVELQKSDEDEFFPEALADPQRLKWHVQNVAWDVGIQLASENTLPCYDREGFNQLVENAKSFDDPFGRHLSSFTYYKLGPSLMQGQSLMEFERFVKRMHGEFVFAPGCS